MKTRLALLALFIAIVGFMFSSQPVHAQECVFQLGFEALHETIPNVVGDCLEDERHNPENGITVQHTTNGLLIWRKADNLTAFTDGKVTWINGPEGIQQRPNSERLPWEIALAANDFVPGECPFDIRPDVDVGCGFLLVPADYDDPSAGQLEVAVAVFRSPNPQAAGAPVVYLGGGPGGNNLQWLPISFGLFVAPFLEEHDFIMLDQRGTGFSRPSLHCPEITEVTVSLLDEDLPLAEELALQLDVHQACRDRVVAEGTDPAWFNTAANAADIDRLRAALGYEQWNLYGVSYGTRLAQTVMRDFPGGVRRVVLDSSYPLDLDLFGALPADHERVFQLLIDSCAADQTCNADYPDLGAALVQAVQTLNDAPASGVVTIPTTGETFDTLTTGDVLVNTLFLAFYQKSYLPLLPEIIFEAAAGNVAGVNLLRASEILILEGVSFGMHYSVQCQDEAPFTSEEEIARNIAANPLYKSLLKSEELDYYAQNQIIPCGIWDVPPSAPIENVAVSSDIPTLILAGEFDPVTPPSAGRAVAANLSQSTFIEFAGASHGLLGSSSCANSVITAFLDARELDTACVGELTAPQWVRPLAKTTLVPYENPLAGFKGVVPERWNEASPGFFVHPRGDAGILQLFEPGASSDTLLDRVVKTRIEEVEQIDQMPAGADAQVWRLFQGEGHGLVHVIAVADFDSAAGLVYVVGLPSQRDTLVDVLLLPALAAFEPPD